MTNVNRKIKDLKKIDEKINDLGKALLENPDKEAYINQKLTALSNEKTLIEKFLSVDNIFVFVMIFSYFSIPAQYQRRVLIYGVIGAVTMRFIMILCGVWLISQFHWILYVFGFLLIILGIKMFVVSGASVNLEKNVVINFMKFFLLKI
jgi:predicted tellurium resistance membrane protein TerC